VLDRWPGATGTVRWRERTRVRFREDDAV